MRRDATVCPHCRRESPAWEYREGRWWAASDEGQDVWYDEVGGKWQTGDELPVAAVTYRVALVKLGDPRASVRLIREKGNFDFSPGALRRMQPGSTVSSGLPEERAVSLKDSLAGVGTLVDLVRS
jgi:hypothetical protein